MKVLGTGQEDISGRSWSRVSKAGHEVVGLDTHLYCLVHLRGRADRDAGDVKAWRCGASDLEFDAVVHLAGFSNDPLGNLDPQLTFEINHRARCAWRGKPKKRGTRFLFSSSCSTYVGR